MKVTMTTTRFVVLDTLFKHGRWTDATTLTTACGFTDPTSAFGVAKGLADLGLVDTMKRRVDNSRSRVKLLTHWRISEAGVRVLDEYNSGRRAEGTTSMVELPPAPVAEPEPEPVAEQRQVSVEMRMAEPLGTIIAMEAEIKRLRAQVAKYADVVVDVPNVGEVRMTKDEVHTLLQHLLELAQEEQ